MIFPAKSLGFGCLGLATFLVAQDLRNPGSPTKHADSSLAPHLSGPASRPWRSEESGPQKIRKPLRSTTGDISLATHRKRVETFEIRVVGYVRQPGSVTVTAGATLAEAISLAGGATEFGSMKRVKLFRGAEQTQHDLTSRETEAVPLMQGDIVEVPQKVIVGY